MKKATWAVVKSLTPTLAIYFSVGLSGLSAVASTFFNKNNISLTPTELISLGVWVSLPWSVKMIFGAVVDTVKKRQFVVYLGAASMVLALLTVIDHASSRMIFDSIGEYKGLLISGLLSSIGIVLCDIVADTLSIEVPKEYIARAQVWARVAQSSGAVVGAALCGVLATHLSMAHVFTLELICPILALIATFMSSIKPANTAPPNFTLIKQGIGYAIICIGCGFIPYGQEILFFLSLGVISFMLKGLLPHIAEKRLFVTTLAALFLFRCAPGFGPAMSWWQISALGFDESFIGTLRITGTISGLIILVSLSKIIVKSSVLITLTALAVLDIILSAPHILIFYNLLPFDPRHIVLVDNAASAAIASLSMIPMGILIADAAPKQYRAAYMTVTASLMNIALVGGDLISKGVNAWLPVSRVDFSNLGGIMIISLAIGAVLSAIGIGLLKFK